MLYIVATPIGNLSDISARALEVLREVSLIACEDTRHTRKLLSFYEIHTRYVSCHSHNEAQVFQRVLLPQLRAGKSIAMVTDAGTPGVSDPGATLVELAYQHDIDIVAIPGPNAVAALISVSGLHGKGFWFEGFLGRKSGSRKKRIEELLIRNETCIFFESPHRVQQFLSELVAFDAERQVLIGLELTKKFEKLYRNTAQALLLQYEQQKIPLKGECVLLVYPRKK